METVAAYSKNTRNRNIICAQTVDFLMLQQVVLLVTNVFREIRDHKEHCTRVC
jgi:hypothetical protein